ncbi:Loki-CTERM sorting domain-containing protein, partial [Candidatus Bathyarchaeota archaeon]|nr:Loki-CTERM sorting domain-containing protein [Candidatus Bathyarchaeota archaeon]
VTTQFGATFVGSQIPGYPALIIVGATGFAVLFVVFRKSKKIKA